MSSIIQINEFYRYSMTVNFDNNDQNQYKKNIASLPLQKL